jgi:sarcosine oxidase
MVSWCAPKTARAGTDTLSSRPGHGRGTSFPKLARPCCRRVVQAWYLPHDIEQYRPEVCGVFERVGDVRAYGFPSIDDATVKIGIYTTAHPIVYDTENPSLTVGPALLRYFRDTIAEFFPGLHPDPVAATVSIEGYTTDGQPLLGPAPDASRVILACGFSGFGFKFAPVFADIAADLVIYGRTARNVSFLAPDRALAHWPPDTLAPA